MHESYFFWNWKWGFGGAYYYFFGSFGGGKERRGLGKPKRVGVG